MALHCWSGPLAGFAVKHLCRTVVRDPRACICLVIVITELVSLVPSISADIGGRCLISMGTKNGLMWTDAHTNAMENIHTTYTCRRTDKCTSYKGGLAAAGWGAPAALRVPVIRYSRECCGQPRLQMRHSGKRVNSNISRDWIKRKYAEYQAAHNSHFSYSWPFVAASPTQSIPLPFGSLGSNWRCSFCFVPIRAAAALYTPLVMTAASSSTAV